MTARTQRYAPVAWVWPPTTHCRFRGPQPKFPNHQLTDSLEMLSSLRRVRSIHAGRDCDRTFVRSVRLFRGLRCRANGGSEEGMSSPGTGAIAQPLPRGGRCGCLSRYAARRQGLTWRQVDFKAGTVRLEPGTTKNDEGRAFPFAALPSLEALLRAQRAHTHTIERERDEVIPCVFHRGAGSRSAISTWHGRVPVSVRVSRAAHSRGAPHRGAELRADGGVALGGDDVVGAPDREHLLPLRYRVGPGPGRGREEGRDDAG
jgi:hypothetical protein